MGGIPQSGRCATLSPQPVDGKLAVGAWRKFNGRPGRRTRLLVWRCLASARRAVMDGNRSFESFPM